MKISGLPAELRACIGSFLRLDVHVRVRSTSKTMRGNEDSYLGYVGGHDSEAAAALEKKARGCKSLAQRVQKPR